MFGFIFKKADVINHWIAFADNFQTSVQDFYKAIENELSQRKVPGLDMSRIKYGEGGALSDKREYLRMLRERLVFDICAAPFGTGFFFSCRFSEIPAVIRLWQIAILAAIGYFGLPFLYNYSIRSYGFPHGPVALGLAFLLILLLMRNLVAWGLHDIDRMLIRSPLIGPLYERILRKQTYYRHDTRLMYLEVVQSVVKKVAEDFTAEKGVKLDRQYEQSPILGELYKRVKPDQKTKEE